MTASDLEMLKKELRSVVVSNPIAMNAAGLNNDYKKMVGCLVPVQMFGYKDIGTFLKKECSDIFKFSGNQSDPTLIPIIDKQISHLNKLINNQKKPPKANQHRRLAVIKPITIDVNYTNNIRSVVETKKQCQNNTPVRKNKNRKHSVFSRLENKVYTPNKQKSGSHGHSNYFAEDVYFNSKCREIYQLDILEMGDEISKQAFMQSEGQVLEITICDVKNPCAFWFHLLNVDHQGKLDNLMCTMNDFYFSSNDDNFIPLSKIEPDLYCAAIYKSYYHRAVIQDIVDCSRIKVFFIDYGFFDIIEISDIRYLLKQFAHLPAQAIKGCQVGISPNRGQTWLLPAICEFVDLVRQTSLQARIMRKGSKKIEVDLKSNEIIRLSMIDRGFAKPCNY